MRFAPFILLACLGGCQTLNLPARPFSPGPDKTVYPCNWTFAAESELARPVPDVPDPDAEPFAAFNKWKANSDPSAPWAALRAALRGK